MMTMALFASKQNSSMMISAPSGRRPKDHRPPDDREHSIEGLSDDVLAHALLYSDFPTAVQFSASVNKELTQRTLPSHKNSVPIEELNLKNDSKEQDREEDASTSDSSSQPSTTKSSCKNTAFNGLWADIYARHGFASIVAPDESSSNDEISTAAPHNTSFDYVSETRRRRLLFDNLTGESRLRKDRALHSVARAADATQYPKKDVKKCLSLPNRYVHFVPLVPRIDPPDDDNDDEFDLEEHRAMMEALAQDPPPVDFGCESYALLPGTSPRLILLDPFDGTIAVHDNALSGAIHSDEAMMEKAFQVGADAIIRHRDNAEPSSMDAQVEADASADAIDREVALNSPNMARPMKPSQVLHDIQDYFATDLTQYFVLPEQMAANRADGDHQAVVLGPDDEIVVDWLGLDLHPIVSPKQGLIGNLVGAARVLTCERSTDDAFNGTTTRSCMEVIGWKAMGSDEAQFSETYVCRMNGFPNYVDIDGRNNLVYATFAPGEGPRITGVTSNVNIAAPNANANRANNNNDEDENEGEDEDVNNLENLEIDWNGDPIRPSNTIVFFPMIFKETTDTSSDADQTRKRFFPKPLGHIQTQKPICCFVVDPTGNSLVVGTDGGCVEILHKKGSGGASRLVKVQTLNLPKEIEAAKERKRLATLKLKRLRSVSDVAPPKEKEFNPATKKRQIMPCNGIEDGNEAAAAADAEMNDASLNINVEDHDEEMEIRETENSDSDGSPLTQCKPDQKIDSIFHPRHLELHRAGFVTLQHSRTGGSTLSLWQKPSLDQINKSSEEPFQLSAIINLPLSPQRKPQVHYDGRRLIVFGQDHIGLIVLVYHVLSTNEDMVAFDRHAESYGAASDLAQEESGGVINFSQGTRRVAYKNRIRHVGLGGVEYYDTIYMTCNERFIVLNTKEGNLVGDGGTNACEGLFVIDLEEKA